MKLEVGQVWENRRGVQRRLTAIGDAMVTYTRLDSVGEYKTFRSRVDGYVAGGAWRLVGLPGCTAHPPRRCSLPDAMRAMATALEMFIGLDRMADNLGGAWGDSSVAVRCRSSGLWRFVDEMRSQSVRHRIAQLEAKREQMPYWDPE